MEKKHLFLLAKSPTVFRVILGWSGGGRSDFMVNIMEISIPGGTVILIPSCNSEVVSVCDGFEVLGVSPGRKNGEPVFEATDADSFIGADRFPGVVNADLLIYRDKRFAQSRYKASSKLLDDDFRINEKILMC